MSEVCDLCGRGCANKKSLGTHRIRCPNNPNRKVWVSPFVLDELRTALKMQHSAIDGMFAERIVAEDGFYPSKHEAWAAVEKGYAAMKLLDIVYPPKK